MLHISYFLYAEADKKDYIKNFNMMFLLNLFYKYIPIFFIFIVCTGEARAEHIGQPQHEPVIFQRSINVVFESNIWKIVLHDNGEIDVHGVIEIFNHGKSHSVTLEVDYDSMYEDVEIVYVRVINPYGGINAVEGERIHDVASVNTKIVLIPGVEKGSIIEYLIKYKIKKGCC